MSSELKWKAFGTRTILLVAVIAVIAVIAVVGCGARTELDLFLAAGSADSGNKSETPDASESPTGDASCSACNDANVGNEDATSADAGSTDASNKVDANAVPLSACLVDGGAVVMVNLVNPVLDTNFRQFTWTPFFEHSNDVDLDIHDDPSGQDWEFYFAAAADAGPIGVGVYDDAGDPLPPNFPIINIGGIGGGCDQTSGSFQIFQFDLDDAGLVRTFAATFSQVCVGSALTLNGCAYLTR